MIYPYVLFVFFNFFIIKKIDFLTYYHIHHNCSIIIAIMFGNRFVRLFKTNKSKFTYSILFGFGVAYDDKKTLDIVDNGVVDIIDTTLFKNGLTQDECYEIVYENPENIKKIPKHYITSKMCNDLLDLNPNNIIHIPTEFITNDMCYKLLKMNVNFYCLIPKEKRNDNMLNMVNNYYNSILVNEFQKFSDIPKELINDKLVLHAVTASKGVIGIYRLRGYKVGVDTQRKLDKFCRGNYNESDGTKGVSYCSFRMKDIMPKLPNE